MKAGRGCGLDRESVLECARHLLCQKGWRFRQTDNVLFFTLTSPKHRFQCAFKWEEDLLCVFSAYPFTGTERMLQACNQYNAVLAEGCLAVDANGVPILRQSVRLTDEWYANQLIDEAIGRQAALMDHCWDELQNAADQPQPRMAT